MKTNRFVALWLCLVALPAFADSPYATASDFAQWAGRLREKTLIALGREPRVVLNGSGRVGPGSRVLMIGDSLSVGAFGEAMGNYLAARFGRGNVALFAAGGSSPQSWLLADPPYTTKCGYRTQTAAGTTLNDFHNGRRPVPVTIPKVETLIRTYRPAVVIVQQGTNWMDGLAASGNDFEHDRGVIDRFIPVLKSFAGGNRKVIWIMPPDSSKFSNRVQRAVETLIRDAARRYSFEVVASRSMTHYIPGKSGGDGVHYNSEPSEAWAGQVARDLDRKLR